MLIVNPNLCFDRTMRVDTFEPGTVSRPTGVLVTAGGKGVNVARTARDLGTPAILVGFLAQVDGDRLLALLDAEGVALRGVPIAGDVRCATIVLEDDGRATVLNEPGPVVGREDLERLVAAVAGLCDPAQSPLVCAGSLPPGLPVDSYGRLTQVAHRAGQVAIVDAAREVLAAALPDEPDLVTPNLAEAEGLRTGRVTEPVDSEHLGAGEVADRARDAGAYLVSRGAQRALVTAGAHGACYVDPETSQWIPAPRVTAVNPIGAGDSLVGGLGVALAGGASWLDAVRHGVTVASAAVELAGAGSVDPVRVRELAAASRVEAR